MEDKHIQDFLESADILARVVTDMDTLGCVGERENKLLGYLIAISRKLDEPLSGIVASSSGVGKSKLVDTLQMLTPPEDVVFTSRLTPQSLYYMQKDFLKHKLLVVEERTGSQLADYAIRTLQSKGKLTLAAAVKNQTVFFEVCGPVSVLETTTSYQLNAENISRCFILHLDESPGQTERIHKYQRLLKTDEGIALRGQYGGIIAFHQAVQRMIKKMVIVIPFADKLTFPVNTLSSRRDHQKFLTLIETVTLLHQYRRKKIERGGVSIIESTSADYEIAFNLFKKTYRDSLFITHNKAGALLKEMGDMDKQVFSRRDIADYTGWPDYRVRDNIRYLEKSGLLEIIQKAKGTETLYKLNNTINLKRVEELEE